MIIEFRREHLDEGVHHLHNFLGVVLEVAIPVNCALEDVEVAIDFVPLWNFLRNIGYRPVGIRIVRVLMLQIWDTLEILVLLIGRFGVEAVLA